MKKIYLSLMLLGAVTFTSCDMDKAPYGALDETTAIGSIHDLSVFRVQLYENLRAVTAGNWIYTTDIQMDHFDGLISNGNQIGMFSKGSIMPSDGDITTFWAGSYSAIATCNAILAKCDEFAAKPGVTDRTLREHTNHHSGQFQKSRLTLFQ